MRRYALRDDQWDRIEDLLLAQFAVRELMHEAALRAEVDPDRLSFLQAVCVVRRKLPLFAALPPLDAGAPCMRRCWPRSWRSTWRAAAAGGCRAGSSAK